MALVLNQYRFCSHYKDAIGVSYHFPKKYFNRFVSLPQAFVYYEPRNGGDQVYFGAGVVSAVSEDTEETGHWYGDVLNYTRFREPVSFFRNGGTWEVPSTMRNSVREIPQGLLEEICRAGGMTPPAALGTDLPDHPASLSRQLSELMGPGRKLDAPALRRVQSLVESYERPSSVTNRVKKSRGSTCQICGYPGFNKRDGSPYCEIHHIFHLSSHPPDHCLLPEYVIVVCATCHRMLHFAEVSEPRKAPGGWAISVNGRELVADTGRTD